MSIFHPILFLPCSIHANGTTELRCYFGRPREGSLSDPSCCRRRRLKWSPYTYMYVSTPKSRDTAGDWPIDGKVYSLGKHILAKQLFETSRGSINQLFQDYKHSLIGDCRVVGCASPHSQAVVPAILRKPESSNTIYSYYCPSGKG